VKLNCYHIYTPAAEIRAADTGKADRVAGSSVTDFAVPKKSTLSAAVANALVFQFSPRFLIPLLSCTVPGLVFAGPQGGQVVAGSASISNPDANTTLITQTSARTAIDWQRFNIGSQEYVQFVQPDASSVALNRVIGGDPSQILGNLSANGQVFLVNPHGVYFGQSATVDVGGLVASVRDISNENFMSGNYAFSKTLGSPDDVGIVNDGVITAKDGGYVVLMGDYVHNAGIIRARLGTVALAAGNSITMGVKGNGLVSVAIEKETLSKLAGVNNAGQIMADGGRVLMTAKVANDLIDTAINNEGLVVANSIAERDGVIFLTAAGGDVVNSGTLDASAKDGSNADGGGVLVYSDKNVINAAGAKISATGDGSADGGVVRVIAANNLDHQTGASIDVSSAGGQGGFVEVSGHGGLSIKGAVELGSGGSLLIDPAVLNINSGSAAPSASVTSAYAVGKGFIENKLNTNNNVTLVASSSINAGGTYAISATGNGDLAIKIGTIGGTGGILGASTSTASGGFNCVSDGFCLAGGGTSGFYNFTSDPTGSVNLSTVTFNLAGGLNIAGGTTSGNVSVGGINAGGNVTITAGTDINIQGNISGAGTSLKASAGNDIFVNGGIAAFGNALNAKVTLNADNNVNINSGVFLANNDLLLAANKDGAGSGDVNIKGVSGTAITVLTQGNLSVSGNNFKVSGASLSFAAADSQVNVLAGNLNVNVSGGMNVAGGKYTPVSAVGTGAVQVSTTVKANNNITINAASLTVTGGSANASPSFASGTANALTVDANASLEAGANLVATLSGSLNVSGGLANANTGGSASTFTATANANAALLAAGNVNITASTVNLNKGTENAAAIYGGIATASATSKMQANNVTLNVASAMNANSASVSAINDVNITAGTYLENISNSIVAGNNLSVSVGGNYAVNGVYSAANLLSLSAGGTLDLNTVLGSVVTPLNSKVTLSAGNHLRLNNDIYLTSQTLTLVADANASGSGDVSIVGSAVSPVNVNTLGDMIVSGVGLNVADANVAAGTLKAEMGGTIEGLNASFDVGALYMSAAANINLTSSTINVGNGTVAGISGDALALSALTYNGIPLPTTSNPNAKFVAGGTLNLGTISMTGNVPYLWMVADTTNIQGLALPKSGDVVVQYSPFTVSKSIGVEDVPDTSELVNYNNLQHFGILPGTTIIVGSSQQTGDINIGNLGKIDIGSKNIVFVTSAKITTIDNIISSGVVAELLVGQFNGQLILTKGGEEFVAPILTEVEVMPALSDDPAKEKDRRKHLIKDDEDKILMCEAS